MAGRRIQCILLLLLLLLYKYIIIYRANVCKVYQNMISATNECCHGNVKCGFVIFVSFRFILNSVSVLGLPSVAFVSRFETNKSTVRQADSQVQSETIYISYSRKNSNLNDRYKIPANDHIKSENEGKKYLFLLKRTYREIREMTENVSGSQKWFHLCNRQHLWLISQSYMWNDYCLQILFSCFLLNSNAAKSIGINLLHWKRPRLAHARVFVVSFWKRMIAEKEDLRRRTSISRTIPYLRFVAVCE